MWSRLVILTLPVANDGSIYDARTIDTTHTLSKRTTNNTFRALREYFLAWGSFGVATAFEYSIVTSLIGLCAGFVFMQLRIR